MTRAIRRAGALWLATGVAFAPVFAQTSADPRFDAVATLAEAKMKEFGVPGVAIGILNNGVATTRGPSASTRSRNGKPTSSSSRNHPPVGDAVVGGP